MALKIENNVLSSRCFLVSLPQIRDVVCKSSLKLMLAFQ